MRHILKSAATTGDHRVLTVNTKLAPHKMKWTILSTLSGADLIYLRDATTGDRFLVNTGTSIDDLYVH